MKTAILYLILAVTSITYGQDTKSVLQTVNVTELSITTDDLEELKTMDWDELLSTFKDNKDEDEKITVSLKYEFNSKKKSGVKTEKSMNVKVNGTAGELEKLKTNLIDFTSRIVKLVEKTN